jgi:DNA mismatch repair protein MutL
MASYRKPILPLPASSSAQLSSGQVILDSFSVVKELIENAIDAKASSISINISANSVDLIKVNDNGHGIPVADQDMLGKRYCTSKIRNLQDLAEIGGKSLGFRGEALNSIVQLAEIVEVITKVDGTSTAVKMRLKVDGISIKSVSFPFNISLSNFS